MPESAQPQDTDVELMQGFIAQHSEQALEEKTGETQEQQTSAASGVAEEPEAEAEDRLDLDDATLQALGLAQEDQPGPSGDSEAETGTEQQAIDLDALAATLGATRDDLVYGPEGLKVRAKVDGETIEVPFAELRKGYQLQSHFTRQQEQFLAERQQWEQARQQKEAEVQQSAMLADQILKADEEQLTRDYSLDWDSLRQEDPAEYAAKVAEYNQRLSRIRNKRTELYQGMQQRAQEMQQQRLYQHQQYLMQEARALAERTGWTDQEKWTSNMNRLGKYLTQQAGIDPQTVNALSDHRAFLVAEKARLYDELMAKVAVSRKKVKEAHKMPTGKAAPKAGGRKRALREAQDRLRNDHSVEAAADVFKQLGIT